MQQNSFKAQSINPLTISDMYCHSNSPFYLRNGAQRFADLGELEQSDAGNGFHHHQDHDADAVYLSPSSIYNEMKASNVSVMQFGGLNTSSMSSGTEMGSSSSVETTGHLMLLQRGAALGINNHNNNNNNNNVNNFHNHRVDSGGVVADHSQQTTTETTSTDDTTTDHHKIQFPGVEHEKLMVVDSMDHSKWKVGEQKALRRLAQNREAARKSRMRKKAYVQQLESSRLRLMQLEQDAKKTRHQAMFASSGFSREQSRGMGGNGALAFDIDYARWLDEHQRLTTDLRSAVNSNAVDSELRFLVDEVMSHYDEIFRLKIIAAKSDVFYMLSGMWKTPAERCFMWLGGFRSSEILKILRSHIEPLTEEHLVGISNLEQTSQQAEDALSQGMEALQNSLVETLSSNTLGPRHSGNVADYMGQMAIAMSKLAALENFLYQADLLRQQTLQQLQRILTTRQAARALLAISDYKSRLRALSSLWLARPKECF